MHLFHISKNYFQLNIHFVKGANCHAFMRNFCLTIILLIPDCAGTSLLPPLFAADELALLLDPELSGLSSDTSSMVGMLGRDHCL